MRPTARAFATTAALALATLDAACAHYEAKPPQTAAFPPAFDARALPAAPAGDWTEAGLLDEALKRAPSVVEAETALRVQRAAARTSRVRPAPTLNLTAEYGHDGGVSPWLLGFTSDIPTDNGGRRTGRITAADLAALQAEYDFGEAAWTTRMALHRAIIDSRAAEQEVGLAERWVALRRERFQLFQARVKAGEDAHAAEVLAQTDYAAADRRLSDAKARREAADVAVAKAMGLSPGAIAELSPAPLAAQPPAPTRAELAQWRSSAALGRRDVLRAVADYDIAESALRTEIAKQFPEVHLGPGYTWERGVVKLPFTLTLVLPPSDLNRTSIHEMEVRREDAGRKLEVTQANVLGAVDTASGALAAALESLARSNEVDLPTARRTAEEMQRLAKAGENDRTDLDGALAAVIEAQLGALDALHAAWSASADMEDALRRPSDLAETAVLAAAVQRMESPT